MCSVHHMSIGEAVRCGCALPQHTETWDIDVIRHPELFAETDALAAFMSNCVSNCIEHAVVGAEVETPRFNTAFGSVRLMPNMAMAMGHKSDTHARLGVAVCKSLAESSRHLPGYGHCVSGFGRFVTENRVGMVEKSRCQTSNHKSEVPHPRFPGARKGRIVQFNNNRAIHPKCGSLVEALEVAKTDDEALLVPLGYNPRRWQMQSIIEAHLKLKRALTMDRVTDAKAWEDNVREAVESVVSKHRPRGVCINREELRIILNDMAEYTSIQSPEVPEDTLREICMYYSTDRPRRNEVPYPLHNVAQGSMRDRRKIQSHSRIPLVTRPL